MIGTRWVHTDKREVANEVKIDATLPLLAKARIVVQGCQERIDIETYSPTASLLCFHLVCAVASMKRFKLGAADAECAYLQGDGINRQLILRSPTPPPPGVVAGQLFRARASIYGTKDAGRGWWKKLFRVLTEMGWRCSVLENCLFYLYDEQSQLRGILATHVDDLFVAGDHSTSFFPENFQEIAETIKL